MDLQNVAYLEDDDLTSDGKLKIDDGGKPVIILLQGLFCGYCTKFKPEFQKLAKALKGRVHAATIVIDKEKKLGKELSNYIPNFRGVPTVVVFRDGKYSQTYEGPRKAENLIEFASTL